MVIRMIRKYKNQEEGLKLCSKDKMLAGAIRFFDRIGFKPTVYENTRADLLTEAGFIEFTPIAPYFDNVWSSFERRYERNASSNQFPLSIYCYKIRFCFGGLNLILLDKHNHYIAEIRPNVLSNATITVHSTCNDRNKYKYRYMEISMNPTDNMSFLEFKSENSIKYREEAAVELYDERIFDWLMENNAVSIWVEK